MGILIETDSRRRISLAKLGIEADAYYLAEKRPDGSILLVPAEVRPKVIELVERLAPDWAEHAATVTDPHPSETWSRIRADTEATS